MLPVAFGQKHIFVTIAKTQFFEARLQSSKIIHLDLRGSKPNESENKPLFLCERGKVDPAWKVVAFEELG